MIDVANSKYEVRCQKCNTTERIPLTAMRGPVPNTIHLPDHLLCLKCGSYLTTRVVNVKKEKEKKS